jgi:predicted PurR-regulated permease PerM
MNREQLFRYFFLGVFLFLLYQVLHILSPFYTGILGAIVLTLIFSPLHRMVLSAVGLKRTDTAAALSTILVIVLIVIPFIFLSWLLLNDFQTLISAIERLRGAIGSWRQGGHFIDVPWLNALETKFRAILDPAQIDLQSLITETANRMLDFAAGLGRKLPRNAFLFIVNLLIMIFTLFFLFRDGHSLFQKVKDLVPMDDRHKEHIASQLYLTVTAIVRGVFLVALAQGACAAAGFMIAGVPSPAVLGFCTVLSALIPLVGAAAVWLPVSLYYLILGSTGKGVFLFLWGALIVSLTDNFLRPFLIGSKAKLPILFLLFGILGGIKVYGPKGLFLGPLVVALVLAFIRIYREEYPQESGGKLGD